MDKTISLNIKANISAFKKGMEQVKKSADNTKRTLHSAKVDAFKGSFKSAGNELSAFQQKLRNTNNDAKNVGANLKAEFAKAGIAIYTATKFLQMMTSSIAGAISRADTLNNFSSQMANMGISASESEQAIAFINEKLDGLPTRLDTAVASIQRFTSVNNNIQASTKVFNALNNALLAGGSSLEYQSIALEQLTQAYSKGKPDIVEWRSAMQAMPAQLRQLALAFGLASPQELYKALSSGKITMNEFLAKVVELNEKGANGFASFEQQARNSSAGIETSLTNLKTAFQRGNARIMESFGHANIVGFIENIKFAVDQLYTGIEYLLVPIKVLIQTFKEMGNVSKFLTAGLIGLIFIAPVISSSLMLIRYMVDRLSIAYIRLAGSSKYASFFMSKGFITFAGTVIVAIVAVTRAFGGFTNFINNFGQAVVATMQYVAGSIVVAFANIIKIIGSLFGQNWGSQMLQVGNSMIAVAQRTASRIKGSSSGGGSSKKANSLSATQESLGKSAGVAEKGMDRATNANKANAKSADKADKANKKLKDNLMGFDEINKITDESSAGADLTPSGGAGGVPSMDIGGTPDIDAGGLDGLSDGFDEFKNKVKGAMDTVKKAMPYIVAFLAIFAVGKLVKFIGSIKNLIGTVGGLKKFFGVFGKLKLLKGLGGITLIIGGLVLGIQGLIDMFNNPSWEAFGKLLAGIALVAGGVALIFGAIPGLITAVIAIVASAVILIIKHWETIKEFFATLWENIKLIAIEKWTALKDWINGIRNNIVERWNTIKKFFTDIWIAVKNSAVAKWEEIKSKIIGAKNSVQDIWRNIKDFFANLWESVKNKLVSIWNRIIGKIQNAKQNVMNIWNPIAGFFWSIGSRIGNIFNGVKDRITGAFRTAWNNIRNIFSGVGRFFGGVRDTVKRVFSDIGGRISSSVTGSFKGAINGVTGGATRVINKIVGGFNGALRFINKVPGVNIPRISTISVPRMATGGVVSARNGGIPAIIGEGRYDEAVVPLGSSPQMEEMKNDIANAVANTIGQGAGMPEKLTIDLTAGGGEMRLGKYIVDLTRKTEAIL